MVRVGNAGRRASDDSSPEDVHQVINKGRQNLTQSNGVTTGHGTALHSQGMKLQTSTSAGYNPFANPNQVDSGNLARTAVSAPATSSNPFASGSKVPSTPTKKPRKGKKGPRKVRKPMKAWKKVLLSLVLIFLTAFGAYFGYFFAPVKSVPESTSGRVRYDAFLECLHTYDQTCLQGDLLTQFEGVQGNEVRQEFLRAVGASVSVSYPDAARLDLWGKPAKHPFTRLSIQGTTFLNSGESVKLTSVDWAKFPITDKDIEFLVQQSGLVATDPVYRTKLTDMFAQYVSGYLATDFSAFSRTLDWTPSITCSEELDCVVNSEEFNTVSRLLFSEDEFNQFQDRFAERVLKFTDPSSEVKAFDPESDPRLVEAQTLEQFLRGPAKSVEGTEGGRVEDVDDTSDSPTPPATEEALDTLEQGTQSVFDDSTNGTVVEFSRSFPSSYYLEDGWVGAFTASEGSSEVQSHVGDGSQTNPAGLDTAVTTVQVSMSSDGTKKYAPISVELTTFERDEEAFAKFEALDTRNRGFTTKSAVKYVYVEYTITNLGTEEVTVTDNSFVGDANANVITSTGKMYGIKSSVTLQPQESGIISSWYAAEQIDSLFLTWGRDFNRDPQAPYFWFRVFGASSGKVVMDIPTSVEEPTPTDPEPLTEQPEG